MPWRLVMKKLNVPLLGTGAPLLGTGSPLLGTGSPLLGTGAPLLGNGAPLLGTGAPLSAAGPLAALRSAAAPFCPAVAAAGFLPVSTALAQATPRQMNQLSNTHAGTGFTGSSPWMPIFAQTAPTF
jgi:hypothetical protein